MRVLFVCRANAGRSQAAMEYYNQLHPGCAESAGTIVTVPGEKVARRYGRAPFLDALREDGIELGRNTRWPLTESMLRHFDRIIVMAEPNTCPKYLFSRPNVEYWKITDGKGQSLAASRLIRDEIKQRVQRLAELTSVL